MADTFQNNQENLNRFLQFRNMENTATDSGIIKPQTDNNDSTDYLDQLRTIRQQATEMVSNLPSATDTATFESASRQVNPNSENIDTFSPEIKTLDKMLGAQGSLTQGYGNPNNIYKSGVHGGIDIAVPTGTAVSLPQGQWRVVQSFNQATAQGPNNSQENLNGGYGNSILVENVQTGEKIRLSHLSKVGVNAGQVIKGGQVIALTGATGKTRGTTGQHIDIEYYNSQGQRSDILKSQYAQYIL